MVQSATEPNRGGARASLGYRNVLIVTNRKDEREPVLEWTLRMPSVKPEQGTLAIKHLMLSPCFEEVLDFVEAFPELGASLSGASKNIARVRILGSDDASPNCVVILE